MGASRPFFLLLTFRSDRNISLGLCELPKKGRIDLDLNIFYSFDRFKDLAAPKFQKCRQKDYQKKMV